MKKVTTQIITKQHKIKTLYMIVEDEIADALESDPTLKHNYLVSQYREYLQKRRETRRHDSLEVHLVNGQEFEDKGSGIDEDFSDIKNPLLAKSFEVLSTSQRWLLDQVYIKGRSNVDIAAELGITEAAIRNRMTKIKEKIKNFMLGGSN